MSNNKNISNQIWLVIAGILAFIAVIYWLNTGVVAPQDKIVSNIELGEVANKDYLITVFYFPSKKLQASALTYYFKQHGYHVDMKKASTVPALTGSKNSPSHIFFNRSEVGKAMKIKSLIEEVIGSSVNAYRFHEEQKNPSMMMVFTEFES